MLFTTIILLVVTSVPSATPAIEELPYPARLLDCFVSKKNKSDTDIPGELISTYCINQFLWVSGRPSWEAPRDGSAFRIIERLVSRGVENARRSRRQAEPIRVRKEYRMLTNKERRRFHNALIKLKQDREPGSRTNIYDTLADIHQGRTTLQSIHGGASFLGWHRVYLFLLEEALRSKDPGVTLPYWDCTLDYEMNDPTESVIFSYRFAGNGDGEVRNGKFRRWGLVRNLGLTGNLMNKRTMKRILKRRRTSEISEPTARNRHNMEFYHNGIHSWVGGDLGFLNTATRDPIFFLLHAFIDYIWWRFQQRQLQLDIDPFTDYPENFGHFRHAPDARMAGFENYVNADGYSSHWTTDIYTYQLSPECPHCGHSNWLDCVSGLCVSKTGNNRPGQRTTLARETGGRVFKSQGQGGTLARESDGRTFNTTRVLERLVHKEAAHPNSIDKEVKDLQNVIRLPARAEDVGVGKSPVQNTFEINGRSSSEQWVFMPVKVINERSGDLIYNSYPVRNGRPIWRDDIYTASNSKELSSFLPHQSAATYEHCKRSRTGVLKIYLRVDGLNYDGHSFEHALTDERLPFSSGYSYVAIKKPGPNATEIMVTAHDECGRMCKPMCRFEGSTDYVSCTGHLRVGADAYDMYAPSVAEAMNLLWKFKHDKNICPSLTDTHVYITFLCDSQSFP